MLDNPFLDAGFQIRWSLLTPDKVESAVTAALAQAESALAAIARLAPEQADYGNTVLALERATDLLNDTWTKVSHLSSVMDSPEMRAAHNAALPKVTAFLAKIPLNPELWTRLKAAAEHPTAQTLRGEHRRLLTESLANFREEGADLNPTLKARLEALQGELAQVTQKYSENVLDAKNAWELIVTDPARVRGLPAHALESARQDARKKGHGTDEQPAWRFTLQAPSTQPVMLYAEEDSLRRQVWEASCAIGATGTFANQAIVRQILALRQEKAAMLGKRHFADLVLARRMAKSGQQAQAFVEGMHQKIHAAFTREMRELEEFKGQQTGAKVAALTPWEIGFWAEKLRRTRYDFDEELLRPYFPMAGVMAGMFEITRRVFGITVTEIPVRPEEVWHPEVKFYQVHDAAGRHIGSFYADWYPRDSKRGGAWMGALITGGPQADGTRAPHLGYICGNLTPPSGSLPALLNHGEVETVFHEFGHLLHHLFGEVEIKSLNGTNVAWDFVELPSQIMENWCWERASLDLFARHHETGEVIPEPLFQRMIAAKNFRSASATMGQLVLGRMDLDMHTRDLAEIGADVGTWLQARLQDYLPRTEPPAPTIENRFGHLFSNPVGYAAGYYSYKWAEVLDADAFTRFQREGIFNDKVGREFATKILSRGNSADPMELFVDFMGRPPDQQALLERAGLG